MRQSSFTKIGSMINTAMNGAKKQYSGSGGMNNICYAIKYDTL